MRSHADVNSRQVPGGLLAGQGVVELRLRRRGAQPDRAITRSQITTVSPATSAQQRGLRLAMNQEPGGQSVSLSFACWSVPPFVGVPPPAVRAKTPYP